MIHGSGRCSYHPDRSGIGICVECRKVICVECTTQFEGINRCARCLAKRLAATKVPGDRKEWSLGNLCWACVGVGALFGTIYLVASVVSS